MIHLLSDLHLEPSGALTDLFASYLREQAREADAVYLLGDIFNLWLGDDLSLREHTQTVGALRGLTAKDVPVYVMRGNRDFLLGEDFCRATGARLLPDPCTVELAGINTLLSHGDRYCTDDAGYQLYRRIVHNRMAQRAYYGLPERWRAAIARRLRKQSRQATPAKRPQITDVNYSAVVAEATKMNVARVIHGHTHRPALHRHQQAGNGKQVVEHWVLPDWRAESDCRVMLLDAAQPQAPRFLDLLPAKAA